MYAPDIKELLIEQQKEWALALHLLTNNLEHLEEIESTEGMDELKDQILSHKNLIDALRHQVRIINNRERDIMGSNPHRRVT